ncbi:deoxyribonuclease I [Anopheles darlingi]|uniref:Deoxyribonuclease I n=1 Tax=Anopheles darlingi TaxID=43151 RepID=W5J2S5_ANODA|nr:deoxyribonuclease I [Anopheles darlingi]
MDRTHHSKQCSMMLLLGFLITLSAFNSTFAACRIYLNGNLTQDHVPLFLHASGGEYKLLHPLGAYFEWRKSQKVLLGCSSIKNVLVDTESSHTSITCVEGQRFRLQNSTIVKSFTDIRCKSTVSSSLKPRNSECANGKGRVYDVGFEVNGLPFTKYFHICYDNDKSSAIYSEHSLPGKSLNYAEINNNRPSFKLGGITSKVRLASVYTQNHQYDRFEKALGSSAEASRYINSSSYLAKGHLTPDGDAIINNWAAATYFFINVAPQWQIINAGNWLRVENAVRKVAIRLNDTVRIITGVHGILELPNTEGRQVAISLSENGLVEIPKWLWKVVIHEPSNSAVVFITLNNPFANASETLCKNICSLHGWHQAEYLDYRKGFTYCCSLIDARKAIHSLSFTNNTSNILEP